MIYAIFGGEYSDWYCIGYFTNKEEAEKYCVKYGEGDYYVKELKDLSNKYDISDITLMYEYEIIFNFKNNEWIMRNEPNRYKYYSGNKLKQNYIQDSRKYNVAPWISFHINLDKNDRKKAEKIAQDYLYKLIYYSNKEDNSILYKYIDQLNKELKNKYKKKEE